MDEAAGIAAALAVRRGITPRAVEMQELRDMLCRQGAELAVSDWSCRLSLQPPEVLNPAPRVR